MAECDLLVIQILNQMSECELLVIQILSSYHWLMVLVLQQGIIQTFSTLLCTISIAILQSSLGVMTISYL